ncbi:MAG: hypothetical protein LBS33_08540, partial [Streptococcaceae bacterium]|nr:hypothetical protein [Streptococcaceae bacterium]
VSKVIRFLGAGIFILLTTFMYIIMYERKEIIIIVGLVLFTLFSTLVVSRAGFDNGEYVIEIEEK